MRVKRGGLLAHVAETAGAVVPVDCILAVEFYRLGEIVYCLLEIEEAIPH